MTPGSATNGTGWSQTEVEKPGTIRSFGSDRAAQTALLSTMAGTAFGGSSELPPNAVPAIVERSAVCAARSDPNDLIVPGFSTSVWDHPVPFVADPGVIAVWITPTLVVASVPLRVPFHY